MQSQNFLLGMDTDTAYPFRDNKKYFKLYDGELVTDQLETGGALITARGNKISFNFPETISPPASKSGLPSQNGLDLRIIGAVSAGEYVVVFTTDKMNELPIDDDGSGSPVYGAGGVLFNIGIIWAFKYDSNGVIEGIGSNNTLDPAIHMIYYDAINFSLKYAITAIGNQETDKTVKVYFADGYHELRQFNVLDDTLIDQPPEYLQMIDNITLSMPKVKLNESGAFKPGTVQYSIQLYNYGGGETTFSPISEMLNITDSRIDAGTTENFLGALYDENINTGKGASITIDDIDTSFDFMRVVRIFYTSEYASPEITIIYEAGIPSDGNLSIVDDGIISLGTISHEAFVFAGGVIFTPADITTTSNRLIAAGIKEDFFDVNFDARAYPFNNVTGDVELYDSDLTTFITLNNDGTFSGAASGSDWDIPEGWDCIIKDRNKYNRNPFAPPAANSFGGYGKNVQYWFGIAQMPIDRLSLYGGDNMMKSSVNGNANQHWDIEYSKYFPNNNRFENYASDINSAYLAGYQRKEIYRFGIVFFDSKGRSSFVKWIGDIKIPSPTDEDEHDTFMTWEGGTQISVKRYDITSYEIYGGTTVTTTFGNNVHLFFKVSNIPEEAASFQIVRVPRRNVDKTIMGAGLMLPVYNGGTATDQPPEDKGLFRPVSRMMYMDFKGTYTGNTIAAADLFGTTDAYPGSGYPSYLLDASSHGLDEANYSDNLFNVISPEISFYKSFFGNPSKISIVGKTLTYDSSGAGFLQYEDTVSQADGRYFSFFKSKEIRALSSEQSFSINESLIKTTKSTTRDRIGGHEYGHISKFVFDYSGSHVWHNAYAGSALVGYTQESISSNIGAAFSNREIAYVYMERDSVQYGGNDYPSRITNKYIPVSHIVNCSSGSSFTLAVFGGDTYISMFEHTRIYHNNDEGDFSRTMEDGTDNVDKTMANVVMFPVESTINIDWRADKPFSKSVGHREMITEEKGSYTLVNDGNTVIFNQETDAYLINYAYIREKNTKEFFPKPLNFDQKTTMLTHRIMASEVKYDGEGADSWLKFSPNNYIDVEGTSGPINAIESIGENLFFFQDKGIGSVIIDPRSIINDSSGTELLLGSGGVFGKVRYITSNAGSKHKKSIVKGNNGIYFYDALNETIGIVEYNGNFDLAAMKGVKKYLKSLLGNYFKDGDDLFAGTYVSAGHEPDNGNIYFSFSSNEPTSAINMTISYNELTKEFVSFHSFVTPIYLWHNSMLITINRDNSDSGWIHSEEAERMSYYGANGGFELHYIVNDLPTITKTFDFVEFDTKLYNVSTGDIDENNTFISIAASNTYPFIKDVGTAKKKFGTWRMQIPRPIINGRKSRMNGKYVVIGLKYNNDQGGNALIVYPMVTHWRPISLRTQ